MQNVAWDPGCVEDANGLGGDQRRLLGGLGDDRVAGDERRRHLAGENGEREVPRADAGENPAATQRHRANAVAADRERQRPPQVGARPGRIVAAEIDRLAHLGDGIGDGLAGLDDAHRHQRRHLLLEPVGGAIEACGALLDRRRRPPRRRARGDCQRPGDVIRRRLGDMAHGSRRVRGRNHGAAAGGVLPPADHRRGRPWPAGGSGHFRAQSRKPRPVGEIDAGGVEPLRQKHRPRLGNARMRHVRETAHPGRRIGDDLVDGQPVVLNPVDEGAVGAVFEQAPDEVGEKVLVLTDRCVDPTADPDLVLLDELLVKALAHAVQPLELVIPTIAGVLEHRGDRMGVVGRELGVEGVRRGKQHSRAGEVGHIRRGLAGEHRVTRQAELLGMLDLRIPVGALDQPDHQPAPGLARGLSQPVNDVWRVLLVRLDDDTEPAPAFQRPVGRQRGNDIERQVEAIGLLRIDVERDVRRRGRLRQFPQPRHDLRHHPPGLRHLVTRMQRRQLDRNSRPGNYVAILGRGADRGDGVGVGLEVALGVGHGSRRLAKHVIGVAIAALFQRLRPLDRVVDGPAHDELAAEDAHRLIDGLAHHGLAEPGDEAAHGGPWRLAGGVVQADHAAGEHQRPGRGVDEQRAAAAEMAIPVRRRHLVADQPFLGQIVGHPQKRLGDAHQEHALLRRQAVFVEEGVEPAFAAPLLTHCLDEMARPVLNPAPGSLGRISGLIEPIQDRVHARGFVDAMVRPDRVPPRSDAIGRGGEDKRHPGSANPLVALPPLFGGGMQDA